MKIKVFQVPEQLFQATANYLATKPYQEVNQLMTALFTGSRIVEIEVPDQNEANVAQQAAPKKEEEGKPDDDKAGT